MGDEPHTPMIKEGLQHAQHGNNHITAISRKDKFKNRIRYELNFMVVGTWPLVSVSHSIQKDHINKISAIKSSDNEGNLYIRVCSIHPIFKAEHHTLGEQPNYACIIEPFM